MAIEFCLKLSSETLPPQGVPCPYEERYREMRSLLSLLALLLTAGLALASSFSQESFESNVFAAVISPNARHLWAGDATGLLVVRDLACHKDRRLRAHREIINHITTNKKGTAYATASADNTVKVWTSSGRLKRTFRLPGDVRSVSFSPNGQYMVAGVEGDYPLFVWNVKTGKVVRTFARTGAHPQVQFVNDFVIVEGTSDGMVRMWDVPNNTLLSSWQAHTSGLTALVASPSGYVLFTAGGYTDAVDTNVRMWVISIGSPGQLVGTIPQETRATSLTMSPDGTELAVGGSDGLTRIYDTSRQLVEAHDSNSDGQTSPVAALSFSGDGKRLATSNTTNIITLWHR